MFMVQAIIFQKKTKVRFWIESRIDENTILNAFSGASVILALSSYKMLCNRNELLLFEHNFCSSGEQLVINFNKIAGILLWTSCLSLTRNNNHYNIIWSQFTLMPFKSIPSTVKNTVCTWKIRAFNVANKSVKYKLLREHSIETNWWGW